MINRLKYCPSCDENAVSLQTFSKRRKMFKKIKTYGFLKSPNKIVIKLEYDIISGNLKVTTPNENCEMPISTFDDFFMVYNSYCRQCTHSLVTNNVYYLKQNQDNIKLFSSTLFLKIGDMNYNILCNYVGDIAEIYYYNDKVPAWQRESKKLTVPCRDYFDGCDKEKLLSTLNTMINLS